MPPSNPPEETNHAPEAARAPLGSRETFDAWVKVHHPALVHIFQTKSRVVREKAEDAVQEGFLELWKNRTKIRQNDDNSLRAYILKVARNWLYQQRKKWKPEGALDDDVLSSLPACDDPPDKRAELQDDYAKVLRLAHSLNPDEQKILRLQWKNGKTVGEIAKALRMPEGTVKSHCYRIIRKFRKALGLPPE